MYTFLFSPASFSWTFLMRNSVCAHTEFATLKVKSEKWKVKDWRIEEWNNLTQMVRDFFSTVFLINIILSDLSWFERFGFGFPLLAAELNLLAEGDNK